MPSGNIVSPLPIGASRSLDATANPASTNPYTNMLGRGGMLAQYTGVISATNRGFDGAVGAAPGDGEYQAAQQPPVYQGLAARHAGGSSTDSPNVDFFFQRPGARFSWPVARHYWEAVMWWSNPAATNALQDSGMCLSFDWSSTFHPRLRGVASGIEQGIEVGIRPGGVLRYISRGAGGTDDVDLSAFHGADLRLPTKVRMQLRHATFDADAAVDIFINDVLALTRTWAAGHKLPVPYVAANATAASGNNPGKVRMMMVSADIEPNQSLYVAQYKYVCGPDTPNL